MPFREVRPPNRQHTKALHRHRAHHRRSALFLHPLVSRSLCCPSPISAAIPSRSISSTACTESLTTDLSRISGSFVIGRNTAFTYKGKHVDLKQIGRELDVRYVLEGSVQRGGNRMRVNVQLIDAETGNHLWAERFDKPLADLFDMQDEIVARLAQQLGTQFIEAEARRAERAPLPDSMDLYFQGRASANKGSTPENMAQARGFFEHALALDPSNIEALVGTAYVDLAFCQLFSDRRPARHSPRRPKLP